MITQVWLIDDLE